MNQNHQPQRDGHTLSRNNHETITNANNLAVAQKVRSTTNSPSYSESRSQQQQQQLQPRQVSASNTSASHGESQGQILIDPLSQVCARYVHQSPIYTSHPIVYQPRLQTSCAKKVSRVRSTRFFLCARMLSDAGLLH